MHGLLISLYNRIIPILVIRSIVSPLLTNLKSPIKTFYKVFFNDTATTEIYTLSLHDALPICQEFPST